MNLLECTSTVSKCVFQKKKNKQTVNYLSFNPIYTVFRNRLHSTIIEPIVARKLNKETRTTAKKKYTGFR